MTFQSIYDTDIRSMRESQASISQWAVETFGTSGTNAEVARRAKEELDELGEKLKAVDHTYYYGDDQESVRGKIASEVADVFIVLMQLGARMGFDALAAFRLDHEQKTDGGMRFLRLHRNATAKMDKLIALLETTPDNSVHACTHTHGILVDMWDLADGERIHIWNAIDTKMAVNRARKWNVKNGFGQHIPDGTG